MSFTQNDIELVRRHTNYSDDAIIIDKLTALNNAIAVITEYIQLSKVEKQKNTQIISNNIPEKSSINQEIYRQIRNRMQIQQKK
jgi:hypothetical protein